MSSPDVPYTCLLLRLHSATQIISVEFRSGDCVDQVMSPHMRHDSVCWSDSSYVSLATGSIE